MAIFHMHAKIVSRAAGSSVVASAAYRAAERLYDERVGRFHNFTAKTGVVHSEIMLPEGAPDHYSNREKLWNAVEARERRKNSQLAREIEFAIPRELTKAQGVLLVRDFVAEQFVKRGMIADINVHWDIGNDGSPKPHAHVLLSTRKVSFEGFGNKNTDWNRKDLYAGWREAWADLANERMAMLDIDARIDHRSLNAQGIDLEPQHKIGPAGGRRAARGENAERADDHRRIARDNGAKIIADPEIALYAITRSQATFTNRDLAMFAHRHSEGQDQYDRVMAAVRGSPQLVALGPDSNRQTRFTSREMVAVEKRLDHAGIAVRDSANHVVGDRGRALALSEAAREGLLLSTEQRAALEHITGPEGLAAVVGHAGTGKSVMLGVARRAWEKTGYTVRGAALSGIAAANLQNGSGIESRTIASLEYQWDQGYDPLTSGDVLVIDEAGLIGTRQMERVMSAARDVGAKVVLVGDAEQLQAIEAGAAFRSLAERHGAIEITEVRRQHDDWQCEATRCLASGRTPDALHAYARHKMVHVADSRDGARAALIERWDAERRTAPDQSRIILTHTNAEVHYLNLAARERLRDSGALGDDIEIMTVLGGRVFASGDRLMFLKNDRGLGVKNGSLGTIEQVDSDRIAVRLENGPSVAFGVRDYAHIDHGYAATIHKTQGVTVDRTHILATPGLDRHSTYVALSRHRDGLHLHYGHEDFDDQRSLTRILSRERAKDMASDYARTYQEEIRAFAERRDLTGADARSSNRTQTGNVSAMRARSMRDGSEHRAAAPKVRPGTFDGMRAAHATSVDRDRPELRRGMFDGLKRDASLLSSLLHLPVSKRRDDRALARAVERTSRSALGILDAQEQGLPVLEHQKHALARHIRVLNGIRPEGSIDLVTIFARDPGLIREAAAGRPSAAIDALSQEARVRADPHLRADRFLERWRALEQEAVVARRDHDAEGAGATASALKSMAEALGRDPQVESILRGRQDHRLQNEIAPDRKHRGDCEQRLDRGHDQELGR